MQNGSQTIGKPDKNRPVFKWSSQPRPFYTKENIFYV
jgi:hypothetical protein